MSDASSASHDQGNGPTDSVSDAFKRRLQAGHRNRLIRLEIEQIYNELDRLRRQSRFPSFQSFTNPMVLVIGNHSSGKSTLINHMIGQPIQKTGRAPTDCNFTVIVGGSRAERMDGHVLMNQTEYGFGNIEKLFGREFVPQIELKSIENSSFLDDTGLMLVDSPGMIDPPNNDKERSDIDRGYNFKNVVQWLAERADVILLMFDPDKPGTTFETLDVLMSSLQQFPSKVMLILNKVDDFETVHDFARAYGALCWNLSKVIPRKDLPVIYTMYVPRAENPAALQMGGRVLDEDKERSNCTSSSVKQLLETEFSHIRDEVIREAARAPDRATDNMIDYLRTSAARLQLHCSIIEACKREIMETERSWKRWQTIGIATGISAVLYYIVRTVHSDSNISVAHSKIFSSTGSAAWRENWASQVSESHATFSIPTLCKIMFSSCASNFLLWRKSIFSIQTKKDRIIDWIPNLVQQMYKQDLNDAMAEPNQLPELWTLVRPGLENALQSQSIDFFPVFEASDKFYVEQVLSIHVQRLKHIVRDRPKGHAPSLWRTSQK